MFQKIKAFFIKTSSIESAEKTAEPIDKTTLNDSLYRYTDFKRDKSLVVWIQSGITHFKKNECVDLNKLKHNLEGAKDRAYHLDRPDITQIIFNFENDLSKPNTILKEICLMIV